MRESQQIAAERRDLGAHTHRTGAEHGKEDHLTGNETTRQALEHINPAFLHTEDPHPGFRSGHFPTAGNNENNEQNIARLAYQFWQQRGCPEGSPDEDWHRAVDELRHGL